VVLSDVWLDSPAAMAQLATLLAGYESVGAQTVGSGRTAVPRASFFTFVLCGNFTSGGLSSGGAAAPPTGSGLKQGFHDLAVLLQRTPMLAEHAHFVLVPGPGDPSIGTPDVLPRAPLSSYLTAELQQSLGHVELAASPCRLNLCGQTVVVHREELLVKARRACVLPPDTSDGFTLNHHLVKSVVDQAHLCPLPQAEAAVYWQLDHAMWLHPAPDVLVLCDRQQQFQHTYEETLAFNPGAFASDLSWIVYRPATKQAEASSLEAA
jgi:DNA polymerase epsilon subunit 2